nr:unnamed protein product [Callosobruchus chinensis]CAH7758458.1 unnamed protein product [Callosobruchus chinensis]
MDEMEKINYSVYLANWAQHLEQSSSVILITGRSQKGVALTAGSFGQLSLETCMRVLNTVVSYYMFLKTMIDA